MGLLQRLRGQAAPVCAANGVPFFYELPPADAAEVRLAEGLLADAGLGDEVGRGLLGDLAYRSEASEETLAERGVVLVTEKGRPARRGAARRDLLFEPQAGVRAAKTLVGLVARIAAKVTSYTCGFYVDRLLGRMQGRIKEPWA